MAKSIRGGCWCGACRYQVTGSPKFAIRCYCRDCQHISGSGSLPQWGVERASLAIDGPTRVYRRQSDSGNELAFTFCNDCGSPLVKTSTLVPDLAFLCAGSLEHPALFPVPRPVYEESRQAWDRS